VEEILDRTNSLSYNQLVIQATQRLTNSIIIGIKCGGQEDNKDYSNLQPWKIFLVKYEVMEHVHVLE
jgi:hypothetical protein